ncbi:unnamed protein product [Pichia kudriavzevii]
MARRGKGNLASKLRHQQFEEKTQKELSKRLANKELNYSKNAKKLQKNKVNEELMEKGVEIPYDEKKVFIPFNYNDRIIIIGDGDFSYSLSIVKKKLIKPSKLITTSYDSLEELYGKYTRETIDANINELRELGVTRIYHEIDGTRLCESFGIQSKNKKRGDGSGKSIKMLGGLTVQNILFNFPHIGKHIKDVNRNIMKNQEMLHAFFKSSLELYQVLRKQRENFKGKAEEEEVVESRESENNQDSEGGFDDYNSNHSKHNDDVFGQQKNNDEEKELITVTLFDGQPYDNWMIKRLARDAIGYSVQRSGKFEWRFYNGYQHRRTAGLGNTNKAAHTRSARIYKFEVFSPRKHSKTHQYDSD